MQLINENFRYYVLNNEKKNNRKTVIKAKLDILWKLKILKIHETLTISVTRIKDVITLS